MKNTAAVGYADDGPRSSAHSAHGTTTAKRNRCLYGLRYVAIHVIATWIVMDPPRPAGKQYSDMESKCSGRWAHKDINCDREYDSERGW